MAENETQLISRLLMAPGAGAGIGKMIADRLLAQPDFVDQMTALISRAMHAKAPRRWDKDAQKWIQDDDMRTQIQTFFGLMAHMEGEPIKRIVHQHLGADGRLNTQSLLHDSPATIAALKREIEKAEWSQVHASGGQRRAAKAAEIDLVSPEPSELPAE